MILALTSSLAACVQPPAEQSSAASDGQTVAAVGQEPPPDGAVLLQTCRALVLQDATYKDKHAVGSRVMPSNNNDWQRFTGRSGPYGTVVLDFG